MKYFFIFALGCCSFLSADQRDDIRADQRRQERIREERNADVERQRRLQEIQQDEEQKREIRNEKIKKQQQ